MALLKVAECTEEERKKSEKMRPQYFFLHIPSSWVKTGWHIDNKLPGTPKWVKIIAHVAHGASRLDQISCMDTPKVFIINGVLNSLAFSAILH